MIPKRIASRGLLLRNQYGFGLGRLIMHWLRTALNRVRWQENQQFHSIERRGSNVPQSAQQATQLFIATQRGLGESQKERMSRIDQILGTSTHFHEGKVFQERIDSDHLITIQQLRLENPQKTRKELDWENPQADLKPRYKHKKSYYSFLSQLRTYPTHPPAAYDLADNTNSHTISFLAKETAYSLVSLKPVELAIESLQNESLLLRQETPFTTNSYCYFTPPHTLHLLRVPKSLYDPELLREEVLEKGDKPVEAVISLDEIYEALKGYDEDQRVAFFLKKVENNSLDYLFSDFSFNKEENLIAVTIDLTGDAKEYCVLIKSLTNHQSLLRPIFNLRPPVVFTSDSTQVVFVQRSSEGGWIELASRRVESFWKRGGSQLVQDEEGMVYRCSAENELKLGRIWNHDFVFVKMNTHGQEYSEKLFLLVGSGEGLDLLPLDESGDCQYFYDLWETGVVLGKKRRVSDQLKYGHNPFAIHQLELIPFKSHIVPTASIGLSDLQLPGKITSLPVRPTDLDPSAKKTIFVPDKHQFITQVQARSTHLVMVLNYQSVYDRGSLYMLPCNPQAHPHSLIMKGDPALRLLQLGTSYNSQLVKFRQYQGLLDCSKQYNIWKRQLSQQEESRYHHEYVTLQTNNYPFQIQLLCKKMYLSQKQLPVILVFESSGQRLNQQVMQQLLEKGVMLVKFGGRGTQTKDLEHYLAGSRQNFGRMMDDLQTTIEFIGNELSKNISLYCKGEVSSLVGLWFNFYFPNLFNASALHNGLYDLKDETALQSFSDFFGDSATRKQKTTTTPEEKTAQEKITKGVDLSRFNVLQYKFRVMTGAPSSKQPQLALGAIENVLITSDNKHRLHSRKLIKRLRENSNFKFEEVYLKEYENAYEADLFNFSYLYSNIRKRMEIENNTPKQPAEQEQQ